jgi:hypothetical protein
MKTILNPSQPSANEKFIRMMIGTIKENGVYGFPDRNAIFTKKSGKFYGHQSDIDSVKDLVSEDFYYLHFGNIDELQVTNE